MQIVWNWPNRITVTRVVLAPLMTVLGLFGQHQMFLILFAVLLLSDYLDGLLARHLHQQSEFGSRLDTVGDVLMAFSAIIGGWLLWPEAFEANASLFAIVALLLVIDGLAAYLKYHRLPSYHTWSAKISTTFLGVGAWLFFAGITPLVFKLAIGLLAVSAVENLTITLLLAQWRSDVPTVLHAHRLRRNTRKACKPNT